MTQEKADKLANYLSEISISLDTVKPEVYDSLRGTKDGLKRVMEGIKHLQKAGIDVHLTCVLTKENQYEVKDIIETAKTLKVHSISFLAVIVDVAKNKDYTETIALSDEEKAAIMDIINQDKSEGLIINTKRMCACEGEKCRAGVNILGITSEGNIMGCIMHREAGFSILEHELTEELLCDLAKNNTKC